MTDRSIMQGRTIWTTRTLLVAGSLALLAFVGCGGSETGGHAGHTTTQEEEHAAEGTVPGSPADASEAAREIEVAALDRLRFDPPTIEVEAGEVVTFVVTNEGKTEHEFVLGDEEYQKAHGSGEDHDMSGENAIMVAPGRTEELTWRFDDAGEVLYGCHVNGHYDGGMVGAIDVQ